MDFAGGKNMKTIALLLCQRVDLLQIIDKCMWDFNQQQTWISMFLVGQIRFSECLLKSIIYHFNVING